MNFGERLFALRKEKGISQADLAERMDVSPQTIHRWENEKVFPDVKQLSLLCEVFGVSSDYFLTKEERSIETATAETKLVAVEEKGGLTNEKQAVWADKRILIALGILAGLGIVIGVAVLVLLGIIVYGIYANGNLWGGASTQPPVSSPSASYWQLPVVLSGWNGVVFCFAVIAIIVLADIFLIRYILKIKNKSKIKI